MPGGSTAEQVPAKTALCSVRIKMRSGLNLTVMATKWHKFSEVTLGILENILVKGDLIHYYGGVPSQ